MVTLAKKPPDRAEFDDWLTHVQERWSLDETAVVQRAYDDTTRVLPDSLNGLAVADLLSDLGMDHESIVAALLHEAVDQGLLPLTEVNEHYGLAIATLVDNAIQLHRIGEIHHQTGQDSEHLEKLRRMLLAMAQDLRVVLLMLVIRLCQMRHHKQLPDIERQRLARETLDIFAPLANRLGIGQIKWELEDLSLYCLDPINYKKIARFLDERRADREQHIERVMTRLDTALQQAGINAQVSGRAKHIYSIWRKMKRKGLSFSQIFDVRAVRIMVGNVSDCYAALGVVHTLWKNIRQEFDDYIANPKENGYQSLHTAVVGPEGKTLEVQIRTSEMHENAELGVAAHWRYKEGENRHDKTLENQIAWFRRMLELKDEATNAGDLFDQIKTEVFQNRVYVLTPKGDIIDLAQGSTSLDFAYQIHTEIGHRCRGARVNGRIVPLTYQLQSGDQVDVITVNSGNPSRNWLLPHLGYLNSSRARAKVRHWFRQQNREKNIAAGQQILEQEFQRLDLKIKPGDLKKIAEKYNLNKVDDLYAAIGGEDITTGNVISAIQEILFPRKRTGFLPISRKPKITTDTEEVRIYGVGNLMTQMAQCCQPIPFEPILGFITQGRGVTIHRQDCSNLLSLQTQHPERVIEVDWAGELEKTYSVDIRIDAYDRFGLLRDITTVFANEKVNISSVNTLSDTETSTAHMEINLEITDLYQLSRLLDKIGQLPNVYQARRKGPSRTR